MSVPKKIVYVITNSNWGGAQRYVFDLATNLSKNYFDVAVAYGGNGLLAAKLQSSDIRVIAIPHLERNITVWKEIASLFSLFKIFVREKPCIVHLNSSKAGGLGAVAARLAGLLSGFRPLIVFTVHGWAFNEDRPFWQLRLIRFSSWLGACFQDRLICITLGDYQGALALTGARKCVLIPNGIGTIDFLSRDMARSFFAKAIGRPIGDDTFLIGTLAELTRNKGLSYLIESLHLLEKIARPLEEKIRMVIMGEGAMRPLLQEYIRMRGLEDRIFLIGSIRDGARYLHGLDLFILPSVKEGLPYALLEAMQAELPVIASDVGGIPDVIEHGRSGFLVPTKRPEKLALAIQEVMEKRTNLEFIRRAAHERIEKKFPLQEMIEQTMAVYQQS